MLRMKAGRGLPRLLALMGRHTQITLFAADALGLCNAFPVRIGGWVGAESD